jgi:RNA polymerase sigma-70 factor (ECF subfamily)
MLAVPLELGRAEQRYAHEPADSQTPETIFDRRWALTVLDRTLSKLQHDAEADGKAREFDCLKGCLTADGIEAEYRALGAQLGISAGAVKVAVHRLRRRYRQALREEIAATVLSDEEVDDELQHLIRILAAR